MFTSVIGSAHPSNMGLSVRKLLIHFVIATATGYPISFRILSHMSLYTLSYPPLIFMHRVLRTSPFLLVLSIWVVRYITTSIGDLLCCSSNCTLWSGLNFSAMLLILLAMNYSCTLLLQLSSNTSLYAIGVV